MSAGAAEKHGQDHGQEPAPWQLIAMHGWAGDGRAWQPWEAAAERRGGAWGGGERGYGPLTPRAPEWLPGQEGAGRRAVMVHSLGLHLLSAAVLQQADAVVLLASFGRFVPEGPSGRRWRTALQGMAARLEAGDAQPMLRDFLTKAAAPESAALLPLGPGLDSSEAINAQRLLHDLRRMETLSGLPTGFPAKARVLIVEAGQDGVVAPISRLLLRQSLPLAERWLIETAGHSLLGADLLEPVFDWLERP